MKNQALKNLIKEEIKNILKEEAPISGASLARDMKQDALNLSKDPSGIQGQEAKGINQIYDLLIAKAKAKTLSPMIVTRIVKILDNI
jgi:hypothetical protein